MRPLLTILPLLVLLLTGSTSLPPSPIADPARPLRASIQIETNPNVETMGILLALAFEGYRFGDFELPVAARAQTQLSAYRKHPAVVNTRTMVQALNIDGYTILALRAAPFGGEAGGTLRMPLPDAWARGVGEGDVAAGQARIATYLRQIAAFYREANLDQFFAAHRPAYDRAEAEVRRLAPDPALIGAMERYYGERLRSYTIIPTLTHPPHGNVGASLGCDDSAACRDAYFVLGTQVSVSEAALTQGQAAGFYDKSNPEKSRQTVSDLIAHEFGHGFVNPYLDAPAVRAEIDDNAHLMLPPLRDRMAPQAYTNWFAVAVEHVVRATEVRVALTAADTARAERLRREYQEDRAFVYLPWLEQAAERYEQDGPLGTGRYATFGAFVPEMARAFRAVDTTAAYRALGVGVGPLQAVTIRVTGPVPAGDTVFVAGGHATLGNWNPRYAPLRRDLDGAWTGTFAIEEGTRLEFKATRGTWASEAVDTTGLPLPNSVVVVESDTTVTLPVEQWRDRP